MLHVIISLALIFSPAAYGDTIAPTVAGDASWSPYEPWIVSLQMAKDDFAYCGGTLLTYKFNGQIYEEEATQFINNAEMQIRSKFTVTCSGWVITAASCLKGVNNIIPTLGNLHLDEEDEHESTCEIVNGATFTHPLYDPVTNDYDVGLIPVHFNRSLIGYSEEAIELCNGNDAPLISNCPKRTKTNAENEWTRTMVFGWGLLREEGRLPKQLYNVTIDIQSDQRCIYEYRNENYRPLVMLCGGGDGKAPCSYDTGGPLICQRGQVGNLKDDTICTYLCGIVSFGKGCGDRPSVFTRIGYSGIWDWIWDTIFDHPTAQVPESPSFPIYI